MGAERSVGECKEGGRRLWRCFNSHMSMRVQTLTMTADITVDLEENMSTLPPSQYPIQPLHNLGFLHHERGT